MWRPSGSECWFRRPSKAPPLNDSSLPSPHHQLGQQILENRLVQEVRQADQRLGVRDALAVDPAEGAVDQTPAHLPLALIEAPVVEMLQDQHSQDDGGRGPEVASASALGMALGQRLGDAIDERFVVEQSVDPAEGGIPQLVGVGQEHFHEAALPVRSPHHGASGETARPQSAPRELRSRATRVDARLPHPCASLERPSRNNCAFGLDSNRSARTNTGCTRSNSHRKVVRRTSV